MKLLLVLLFLAGHVHALDEVYEVDYLHELDDETYRSTPQLYRGEGEHQCQSRESIGHSCKNLGVNFTDCNHAFYKLKLDDCCAGSTYGGTTIGFKLTKCTKYL